MRASVIMPPLRVSRDFIDYPYFADLGAVQAAAVLRHAGWDVTLLDALALPGAGLRDLGHREVQLGVSVDEIIDRLPAADVQIVAYTPFHRPPSRDERLARLLAAASRRAPVALADLYQSGQHYVAATAASVLGAYPDAAGLLQHEAEDALDAFCRRVAAGERAIGLSGGEVRRLDELPLPAWDLLSLPDYFVFHERVMSELGRSAWAFPIDRASAPVVTSRGCPFRCVHCSSNPGRAAGAPKTQRRYSRAYLGRLLDLLHARGVRRVHVLDELANVNEGHFDALLDELSARGMSFEIPNGLRADYVRDRHLDRMAGRLTTLSVSAESGSARVVEQVVDKQLDLGAIERVCAGARRRGLATLVHFLIGLPGESADEINETLALATSLHERHGAWPSVQYATPLPGTRLADEATDRGRRSLPLVDDWGPRFQQLPTASAGAVPAATLVAFRTAFERRLAAAREPRSVEIEVTARCNNRCDFCAAVTLPDDDPAGAPRRQLELLTRERQRGARRLILGGGEPTLAPHLVPLIRRARAMGYDAIELTTNGRMLSYPDVTRSLVTSGLTSLRVSLQGPDAPSHAAAVGGVDEAFAQTCDGVRLAVALAPPGLSLAAVVTLTADAVARLDELATLVEELGLRHLELRGLTAASRRTHLRAPDDAARARAIGALVEAWRDRLTVMVVDVPPCQLPEHVSSWVADRERMMNAQTVRDSRAQRLTAFRQAQRVRREPCLACTEALLCGGFVSLSVDPPWVQWAVD